MKMLMQTLITRMILGLMASMAMIGGMRPPEATGKDTVSIYRMTETHNSKVAQEGWTAVKVREYRIGPISWTRENYGRRDNWRFDGATTLERTDDDGNVIDRRYVFLGYYEGQPV